MDVGTRTSYGEFVRDVGTAGDTSYFVKTPGAVRRLNFAVRTLTVRSSFWKGAILHMSYAQPLFYALYRDETSADVIAGNSSIRVGVGRVVRGRLVPKNRTLGNRRQSIRRTPVTTNSFQFLHFTHERQQEGSAGDLW